MRIILASGSPRRRELLGQIFSDFEIITADCNEDLPCGTDPCEGTRILAVRKGDAVYNKMKESGEITEEDSDDVVIISSDTLVAYDGIPLGKPADEQDAVRMLKMLSGNVHSVHTGVAVRRGERVLSATDTTDVKFINIPDEDVFEYVATGEPMDKAGAYGIQGKGGKFVEYINGEYNTVVGLSLLLTEKLLREIGAI